MDDKQYLDNILESIQNAENANLDELFIFEGEAGDAVSVGMGAGFLLLLSMWTTVEIYRGLRGLVDKKYKLCRKKSGANYKKCRLQATIAGADKAVEIMRRSGPMKCKSKKDPNACMQKLKRDIAKIQAKRKVAEVKLGQM